MSLPGWKHSMNPKVHQRAVNRVVRALNKNIEQDNLWQGRFFMRQWSAQRVVYEDHSGMYLALEMRLYDKKTQRYVWWFCDSYDITAWYGSKAWEKMNEFITVYLNVWSKENPYHEIQNWRKVSTENTIKNATSLWGGF